MTTQNTTAIRLTDSGTQIIDEKGLANLVVVLKGTFTEKARALVISAIGAAPMEQTLHPANEINPEQEILSFRIEREKAHELSLLDGHIDYHRNLTSTFTHNNHNALVYGGTAGLPRIAKYILSVSPIYTLTSIIWGKYYQGNKSSRDGTVKSFIFFEEVQGSPTGEELMQSLRSNGYSPYWDIRSTFDHRQPVLHLKDEDMKTFLAADEGRLAVDYIADLRHEALQPT